MRRMVVAAIAVMVACLVPSSEGGRRAHWSCRRAAFPAGFLGVGGPGRTWTGGAVPGGTRRLGSGLVVVGSAPPKTLETTTTTTTTTTTSPIKRDVEQGAVVSDKWSFFKHSSPEERRAASEPIGRVYGLGVLLVGKPCSGKGTQAPLMARKYRMVHISTGNLLRAEMQCGTELGLIAKEQMEKGELLPDELMMALVKKRVAQEDCQRNGWILDGFPRTISQAQLMKRAGIVPDVVLELDRPDELVREWCLGRYHDAATGVIYHPRFNPPPPDVASRLIWRTDDVPDVLERRLHLFQDKTLPLLGRIDTARNELEVLADISKVLEEVAEKKRAAATQDGQEVTGEEEEEDARSLQPDVPVASRPPPSSPTAPRQRDTLRHAVSRCNQYNMADFLPVYVEQQPPPPPPSSSTKKQQQPGGGVVPVLVGYCSKAFASELSLLQGDAVEVVVDSHVTLAPGITAHETRTRVVGGLVEALVSNGLIPKKKIRNEGMSVRSMLRPDFTSDPLLILERGAMTPFGIASHGVHVNGLVRDDVSGGGLKMWVGRRSSSKATYPGLLDVMAAGGKPSGWKFRANAFKECEEEASIPRAILEEHLQSAGMISYRYQTSNGCLSTKLLHIYDLWLPSSFVPYNGDGEVEAFMLMGVQEALESIQTSLDKWKPNAALTVIDLAVRHGVLDGDHPDYIEIAHFLRGAFTCKPQSTTTPPPPPPISARS